MKFGKLNYTVHLECDQELARFAYMNNRVLAIFSNDSDFLIFAGSFRYFSTKDLNFSTLKTKEFDRKALQNLLKLNSYQMSILATLAGNDIVLHHDLQKFHEHFGFRSKSRFPALAKYIRKNFDSTKNHAQVLSFLAKEIYGNSNTLAMKRISDSIMSYNVHSKNDDSVVNPSEIYVQQHHIFTYNVLSGSPINFSLVFVDLRQNDMLPYFGLAAPMFQRQAGIVLRHSVTSDALLKVYTKTSHRENYRQLVLSPVQPPFEVPLLEELYSDDGKFDAQRFELLKWTINFNKLKDFELRDIPANYMIDVLTLVFMRQERIITSKEADIFLWTIKNVENQLIAKDIKPPPELDPRAFRLAFLYVRIFANVARSIEVCGLKKRYWVS